MGITYSSITIETDSSTSSSHLISKQDSSHFTSKQNEEDKPESHGRVIIDERDILRGLQYDKIKNLVSVYNEQYIPPILDRIDLTFLMKNAIDTPGLEDTIVESVINIFSEKNLCRTYEVIAIMILLCDADWKIRIDLLFELFKCAGTEEIYHEDIRMAVQSISVGLCKLWKQPNRCTSEELYMLSENLANHAFMKVEKDMDDTLKRTEFNLWAFERLKESRTIANWDSLKGILESSHISTTSALSTPRINGSGKMIGGIQGEDLHIIDVNNDGEEIPRMVDLQNIEKDEAPLFSDNNIEIDDILNKKKEQEIENVLYMEKAAEDVTDMLGEMDINIDDHDHNDVIGDGIGNSVVKKENISTDLDSKENYVSEVLCEGIPSEAAESETKITDIDLTDSKQDSMVDDKGETQIDGVGEEDKNLKESDESMHEFNADEEPSKLLSTSITPEVDKDVVNNDTGDDDMTLISDITTVTRAPLTSVG